VDNESLQHIQLELVAAKFGLPLYSLGYSDHIDCCSNPDLLFSAVPILHYTQYILDMLDVLHYGYASSDRVCHFA
jgi:hypothetical protein